MLKHKVHCILNDTFDKERDIFGVNRKAIKFSFQLDANSALLPFVCAKGFVVENCEVVSSQNCVSLPILCMYFLSFLYPRLTNYIYLFSPFFLSFMPLSLESLIYFPFVGVCVFPVFLHKKRDLLF